MKFFEIFALEILDFRNSRFFFLKYFRNFENVLRKCFKAKKCYWLLQNAKYFKAWGFWLKNKQQKNKKKLLHECSSSKLEASRTKKNQGILQLNVKVLKNFRSLVL